MGGIVALVYLPVLRDLGVRWWDDPNYSHGFLVFPVAIYLMWRARSDLKSAVARPHRGGLVMAILGMLLFIVANAGAEYFSVAFSLVLVLFGLTLYLLGGE